MTDMEKREQVHELLDLIFDINGFEERLQEKTGSKPTLFLRLSGHVAKIWVDVYGEGWRSGIAPDNEMGICLCGDGQDISNAIIELRKFKEEMKSGKNSNNSI